ncbi:MAG: 4Fe-4S dicluster domain-containing protein [Proteobacteria bacterium]|nr:4Fe-4S dicluster domain-containing protein [Pseudomonadota bacterium]MBU1581790.1 4Fe-4S dicluster domain-containing protein [Pseudomonadota bacterium]MBU2452101.1 4Fe-4S dicluster domain-containing protein [Pseudomonadota bacterium]
MENIDLDHMDFSLVDQVEKMSKTNLNLCWHCLTCSGGCPISEEMDYSPNSVIRMIQFGLKEEVLKCSTIWLCVGCNNCSAACPNSVDMASIMDSLRQIAILEDACIAEPGILSFHNKVVDSIQRYGRAHKFEIMMRYKLSEKDFFSDIDLGFKMFSKRKLEIFPSKVKDKKSIQGIFEMAGELS